MKNTQLFLARLSSFLGIFCFFAASYLTGALFDLSPPNLREVSGILYQLSFAGTAISIILCPVFFPTPARGKPLLPGIIAIIFVTLPQIIA